MPARQLWKRGEHTSLKTCQWRRQYPRKRSHGRWEGRYTAGYDPKTGKRINKNVLGRTQAEVREKLRPPWRNARGWTSAERRTNTPWLPGCGPDMSSMLSPMSELPPQTAANLSSKPTPFPGSATSNQRGSPSGIRKNSTKSYWKAEKYIRERDRTQDSVPPPYAAPT